MSRAALAGALLFCCAVSHAADVPTDFELYDLHDKLIKTASLRSKHRYLVLDFYADSCVPCRRSIAKLPKLAKWLHGQGARLIVVAEPATRELQAERTKIIRRLRPLPLTVVWDKYHLIAKQFGVYKKGLAALPQVIVVDSKGRITGRVKTLSGLKVWLRRKLQ